MRGVFIQGGTECDATDGLPLEKRDSQTYFPSRATSPAPGLPGWTQRFLGSTLPWAAGSGARGSRRRAQPGHRPAQVTTLISKQIIVTTRTCMAVCLAGSPLQSRRSAGMNTLIFVRATHLCAETPVLEDLVDEQPRQHVARDEEDLAKPHANVDVGGQQPGQERGVAVGGPVVGGSSLPKFHFVSVK